MPDLINGFITPAAYIKDLRGSADYYEALALNYPNSQFSPGEPLFSLRFNLSHAVSIQSTDGPLARQAGKVGGAILGYGPPYAGNGFTGSAIHAIPEYWVVGGVMMNAELWHIPVEGDESLVGVLAGMKEWAKIS